jgi:peptidoglycan/xylan/chitin deacetylase (PgdA/CDA1 family)
VLPIFFYHGIDPSEAAQFALQVKFLRRKWDFVPSDRLADCLKSPVIPARTALLTFDDALQNVADNALPVLREMQIPSTVFVPTGLIGGRMVPPAKPEPVMSWETIRALDGPSVRFESHTVSHPNLDRIAPDCQRQELQESRAVLEKELGRPVTCICYPYGFFNSAVKQVAAECGYRVGLTTITSTDPGDDPFEVPRILIRVRYSLLEVWLLSRGAYNWMRHLAAYRRRRREEAGL